MKRKFLRMIAGIMCGVMLVTSNGIATLAAPSEISEMVDSAVSEEKLDGLDTEIQADTEAIDIEGDSESDSVNEKTEIADMPNSAQLDDAIETEIRLDDATIPAEGFASEEETEEIVSTEVINPTNARAPESIVEYLTINSEGILSLLPGADKTKLPTEISAETFRLLETEGKIIKIIPAGIFNDNSSVVEVEIPNSVTVIAAGAFEYAQNLSRISFENASSLTELPSKAFYNCKKLGEDGIIWIPDSVTKIGEDCFSGCSGITSIEVENSNIVTIGERAFQGCNLLESFPFSKLSKLITIKDKAFDGCAKLKSVNCPSSVQSIEANAFSNCSSMELVDLSKTMNLSLARYAFANCGVRELKFSDDMTEIAPFTFTNCERLGVAHDGAAIPLELGKKTSGISKICSNAFANCKALKEIILNESVNTIEANAFSGCLAIYKITVNSGASSMDDGATIDLNASSFPINKGMTVYGYAGTVKEWQGQYASQGVKYGSLYPTYPVAVSSYSNGVTLSLVNKEKELRIGDVLIISVEPEAGYSVLSITVNGEVMQYNEAKKIATLTIKSNNIQNEKIQVKAGFIKNENAQSGTYDVAITDDFDKDFLEFSKTSKSDEYKLLFGSSYMSTSLKFARNDAPIGNWAFRFSSSDSSSVSVDADGNIRALKKVDQPVIITATLKANEAVKKNIYVTVKEEANLQELKSFAFGSTDKKVIPTGEIKRVEGYFYTYIDESLNMDVLQISNAAAKSDVNTIPVTVNAVNSLGKIVDCGYTWTVLDTKIAEVSMESTNSSKNTIKAKSAGQTTVTVTSKIANKAGEKVSKSFIIRVIDMTPIIEQQNIRINPSSEEKVYFDVVPVYGSSITDVSIGRKSNTGFKEDITTFIISQEENNRFILNLTNSAKEKYKKSSPVSFADYYLKVEIDNNKSTLYEMKMPKITVSNVKPNASIKLSGKLNTFYTGNSGSTGLVSATVSASKEYVLDNTFEPVLMPLTTVSSDQKFVENFSVEAEKEGDNSKLVITQKANKLACDVNGKPITTGYIRLKYVGYDAIDIKVTIPSEKKAPQYVLSQTKLSTSMKAKGQVLELKLLDKKTKKPVDLSEADITYDPEKSTGVFDDMGMKPTIANDCIQIELPNGLPSSAKAVLNVTNVNWTNENPLQFTLNVNAVATAPKVTFANSTMTINSACDNEVETEVKVTMADDIQAIDFTPFSFAGKSSTAGEGEKIAVSYEDGFVKASYENIPTLGTYSFKAVPTVTYIGGKKESLAPVTIKVSVVNRVPSIKLSASSTTLNTYLAGENVEQTSIKYSWGNMTQGSILGYIPDTSRAEIWCDGVKYNYDSAPIKVNFVEENNVSYINLSANESFSKTTKVLVKNLSIGNATVSGLSFTVKANDKVPTLSIVSKGSINVLDKESAIAYTVTVKNFNGILNPDDIEIVAEAEGTAGFGVDFHYELKPDEEFAKNKKLYLRVKSDSADKIKNLNYTIQLKAKLGEFKTEAVKITFKPTQTMPKLSVSPTNMNFYMGAAGLEKAITVTQTSVKTAEITDVKWASTMSDSVKKAFGEPIYDSNTGKLIIKVKNPALLKTESAYNLTYEIVCKNQLIGTTGTTFTVKVTMK